MSHISIPYRMTPPPSPLSPLGAGGSKESPSVLVHISSRQGSYCSGRQTARQPQRNRWAAFQDACPACFCNSLCSAQRRPVAGKLRFQGATTLCRSRQSASAVRVRDIAIIGGIRFLVAAQILQSSLAFCHSLCYAVDGATSNGRRSAPTIGGSFCAPTFQRGGVRMVTYSDLIQIGILIVGIISLFIAANNKK